MFQLLIVIEIMFVVLQIQTRVWMSEESRILTWQIAMYQQLFNFGHIVVFLIYINLIECIFHTLCQLRAAASVVRVIDCHDILEYMLLRNWCFSSLPAILGVPGLSILSKFHLFLQQICQICSDVCAYTSHCLVCPNCVV